MSEPIRKPEAATVWVQYKGTELCADFACTCGRGGHIDARFAYSVQCGACGQIWVLPQTLKLVRAEEATEADGHKLDQHDAVPVPMDDWPRT
jgi:hypothetical protein